MLRIHDQFAPIDFMVLDMGEEEDDMPIILGRPFLSREKVRYYFNSYTTYEQPKKSRSRRRHRSSRNHKNQSPKKSQEEDEEPKEVVKDEPTLPKSSLETKQVCKEKVTSPSETPSHDVQPSGSPSLRLDDAPKE